MLHETLSYPKWVACVYVKKRIGEKTLLTKRILKIGAPGIDALGAFLLLLFLNFHPSAYRAKPEKFVGQSVVDRHTRMSLLQNRTNKATSVPQKQGVERPWY